jgi:hypothetical protein
MAITRTCVKCGGRMVQGVTIDKDQGMRGVSSWLEGAAVKGWFGVKLGGRKPLDIETWRCNRCGLLESYAPSAH